MIINYDIKINKRTFEIHGFVDYVINIPYNNRQIQYGRIKCLNMENLHNPINDDYLNANFKIHIFCINKNDSIIEINKNDNDYIINMFKEIKLDEELIYFNNVFDKHQTNFEICYHENDIQNELKTLLPKIFKI